MTTTIIILISVIIIAIEYVAKLSFDFHQLKAY